MKLWKRDLMTVCLTGSLTVAAWSLWADSKQVPSMPAALSEIERLRLDKVSERQKTNQAQAALLDELHRENLEAAKGLEGEYNKLLADTCRAHDLDPTNCVLLPDGSAITLARMPAAARKGK